MSDTKALKELEKYKEEVKENVTVLLEKTFPEKILELNKLLTSDQLSIKRLHDIHNDTGIEPLLTPSGGLVGSGAAAEATSDVKQSVEDITKRFMQYNLLHLVLPPEGRVKCNETVKSLLELARRLQFELLQHVAQVKIAITYFIPKVEDGNNFGVEIQEETVKMIKSIEDDLGMINLRFSFKDYCQDRARFAADICKDPHIDDYRLGLRNLDENAFIQVIHLVTFIRDAYGKMHDVITKNIEKIKKPRTSNAANLF